MSSKLIFIDTETTGRNPELNAIVQIGMIVDIDYQTKMSTSWTVRPHPDAVIEDEALQVHGFSREQIAAFDDPAKVHREMVSVLKQFIDQYRRSDKAFMCAYNGRFDMDFLRKFFYRCGDNYFGSFFRVGVIDPMLMLPWMVDGGLLPVPSDFKLITVCRMFRIDLAEAAHDAMADIVATRELYYRMRNILFAVPPGSKLDRDYVAGAIANLEVFRIGEKVEVAR